LALSEQRPLRLVALLGRRDSPTDGLYDYCTELGRALEKIGIEFHLGQVPWEELGWRAAIKCVRTQSTNWKGRWVVLQYTALSWSRRGIPVRVLQMLHELRRCGARSAIVFHDAQGFGGESAISHARRRCQHLIMRAAYRLAERSILTVPLGRVPWLPARSKKAVFIPVGSGVSDLSDLPQQSDQPPRTASVVAVFGVTGGEQMQREVSQIAKVICRARRCVHDLHLVVVGRGSEEARGVLSNMLSGKGVSVSVLGVRPAYEVARILSEADALLFVRGHVSSRRSSAIAGISCGVPVIGYYGHETDRPITDAGVVLVAEGDCEALGDALARVLADGTWRAGLRDQALRARREHFSWEAIGQRFREALGDG
jgi:glycosyltransferase involved in cell wall biosynthesis